MCGVGKALRGTEGGVLTETKHAKRIWKQAIEKWQITDVKVQGIKLTSRDRQFLN